MAVRSFLLTLAALVATTSASAAANAPPSALKTAPCQVGQSRAAAICGTLMVYEDRAAGSGRTIGIHFVVIEAKHRSHRAMAFNPGGPGASAADLAAGFADSTTGDFATLRDQYDILLVDNRGTGKSAPQPCDFAPAAHPELFFLQAWPDALVRSCRDQLAKNANLSLYGTSMAADDLDDVRAALGYPKLVLYGGSYGTRFYLDYARRHPDSVESIVLQGVAPPHYYILPLPMGQGAQTAIDGLEKACRNDPMCSTHFPQFAAHFDALVQRFDAGPVSLSVRNTVTHKMQTVQLSKEVFVETIRHAMYFPGDAAYIPVTVERAYHDDYTPLAEMVSLQASFFSSIQADGLNLSVTCAEDIPFITESAVASYSAGTFEGDARIRAQQRACKLWNVTPVPSTFVDPVRSNAPILMISGTDDPASPPQYAQQALASLPNARIMLIPNASHDSNLPPCVDTIVVAFVRAQSAAGLDLSHCAAKYTRPAFAALAYDEVAPGETAAQKKRFTTLLNMFIRGKIDRSQFTPAFSKQLTDANLADFAAGFASNGALQTIVYKGVTGPAKSKVYTYFMRFAQGTVVATITVDSSNRIAGLDFE